MFSSGALYKLVQDAWQLMFFVLQVKQAYKKLALRWHPDLLPAHERPQAEAHFKDISAAYERITQGVKLCNHDMLQQGKCKHSVLFRRARNTVRLRILNCIIFISKRCGIE